MKKQPELTDKTRKDVMKLAGYNRSTFYQYFEDIYSLRDYVEDDVLKNIKFRFKESGNNANELLQFRVFYPGK